MSSLSPSLRETAQVMAWELESNRLRVALVPCQRGRRHNRIRVVDEQNPEWYRALCRQYQSERRGRDGERNRTRPLSATTPSAP